MGSSLRSSAKDFRMAWGELFLYAWSCLYRYWLIPAPARLLACGQPCSEKTRPKENTNAPNFAKPLSQPSSPPRSGFVQQAAWSRQGPAVQLTLDSYVSVGWPLRLARSVRRRHDCNFMKLLFSSPNSAEIGLLR